MANTIVLEPCKFSVFHSKTQCFPVLRPYPLRFASFPPPFFANPNPKPLKPFVLTLISEAKPQNSHMVVKEKTLNPIEFFLDSVSSALGALKKPAIAAVLLGLLLMYDPKSSLAASGGRMGGRSFSSGSRSSSRSSSGSSSRSSSGSSSRLGSRSSLSSSSRSSTGSGSGSSIDSSSGSYTEMQSETALSQPAPDSTTPSGFRPIFWKFIGCAALILVAGYFTYQYKDDIVLTVFGQTSVIKFQVGVLGTARSLQRDLNRIAETADTSTPKGLKNMLQETTLALLRHSDHCISAYSSVDVKIGIEEGEKKFNRLSTEERGKFDEETLVNMNGIKKRSTKAMKSAEFSNEYIVITIVVAAGGEVQLPAINGSLNLKETMQKLTSIPSSRIMAAEVLWTPQTENDTLSEKELLEDYPQLKPL